MLLVIQFAYNNSESMAGISPFYVNYGIYLNINRDPREVKPIAENARILIDKIRKLHIMMKIELEKIKIVTIK